MKLPAFISNVDKKLASLSGSNALKSEEFTDLFETLLSTAEGSDLEDGTKYLGKQAKQIIPKTVLDVIENVQSLKGDDEALLAIAVNGLSDSLNSLALDVTRRKIHGSDEDDVFAKPMDRLTKGLINQLELRGVMLELGVEVPDEIDVQHWTGKLFQKAKTLAEFRSMNWNKVSSSLNGILIQDRSKMEQLFTGKMGPKTDVEHIPQIREELRSKNIDLGVASQLEKKNRKSITDVTKSDIDSFKFEEKAEMQMKKTEKNDVKNKLRSVVSKAKSEKLQDKNKKQKMTDEEAFAIGQKIKGGSETLKGLDDLADIAPLISSVTGFKGPQVALAIAATKILAQEMENRQKEADEMLQENKQRSKEARDEALRLLEKLDVKSMTEDQKKQLQNDIDLIRSKVQASASFSAIGEDFDSEKILRGLESNSLKLSSTEGGVIESYSTNEELVASVSGALALHGITLLLGNYPIESSASPILKQPDYVDIYGVAQPFQSSVFKCTSESELSTFHKTATSGGMSMATSTSSSKSNSRSFKGWGISAERSSGTSSASELAMSKRQETESNIEKETKIKKGFLTEYVKMPMRSVRIPYDAMRLSEDAKREVSRISTIREALRFLRTFGSHLSCGDHTLGGVFFRTIAMESEEDVSSVEMYSAAGNIMSHEVSTAKTSEKSGGASFGLFGMGPKIGTSSSTSTATKSGGTNFSNSSLGTGTKSTNANFSYSMTVASLGPNASTADQFYQSLSTNTGTWSIIDRGELDHVIPVWDLIRDELLDTGENDDFSEEQKRISKACRLLKRAWAMKTREYLQDSSTSFALPDAILHTIDDFVAVNETIGTMVHCICSVVRPNISMVKQSGLRGNRKEMLKSLQILVRKAKEAYTEAKEFPYGDWFLKDLFQEGEKKLTTENKKKDMVFPEFAVEPLNVDSFVWNEFSVSTTIRKMHSNAAECAQNLTLDAWEDLCDEFVRLARIVKMPYFRSTEDKGRTAKIWNIANLSGGKHVAHTATPIEFIQLDAMKGATIYCPDAVSPIEIFIIPPLVYEKTWNWMEILVANRFITRKLYPGQSYYLFRGEDDEKKKSADLLPESTLLQSDKTIIENEYDLDVYIHVPERVLLPGKSVYLFNKVTNEQKVALSFTGINEIKSEEYAVEKGKRYIIHFRNEDPLLSTPPKILQPREKIMEKMRRKGSLLVSFHSKRRMHIWQGANSPLNSINSDFPEYCQDQFWIFEPTQHPLLPGESYEPEKVVFTIKSKKTDERLYAKIQETGGNREGFGLILSATEDIEDSQKWQIHEEENMLFIVNAHSDRYLGLEDNEGNDVTENQHKLNRVIAARPEQVFLDDNSPKNFHWFVTPWKLLHGISTEEKQEKLIKIPDEIKDHLPSSKIILKRSTLPSENILVDGGIVIINDYPNFFTVQWDIVKSSQFNLMPNSTVFLPAPLMKESTSNIRLRYNTMDESVKIEKGKVHFIHYTEDDPLCLYIPRVLTEDDRNKEEISGEGFVLISQDKAGNLLRLGGISKKGNVAAMSHINETLFKDQIWEIEPTATRKEFRIISSKSPNKLCLSPSNESSFVTASDASTDTESVWIIDLREKVGDLCVCSVKNKKYDKYLQTKDDQCLLQEKVEGNYWTIIKKSEINSKFVKNKFSNVGLEKLNIQFKDESAPDILSYRSAISWNLAVTHRYQDEIISVNPNTKWEVENIVFYDPCDMPMKKEMFWNAFASGSVDEKDPLIVFQGASWTGKPDNNGKLYIGMNFKQRVRVKAVELIMKNASSVNHIHLQRRITLDTCWVTCAESNLGTKSSPIEEKRIRLDVNNVGYLVQSENLNTKTSISAKQLKFITHSQYNKLPLPIKISVDVELENLNDSAHLWFSFNKARWGDPNCDALTWYFGDPDPGHAYVFRFDGYKIPEQMNERVTSYKRVPAMVMNTQTVGLKATISCKITTTKAEYSINGVKYGEASYLQGTVPEVGYFGFDTTWNSGALHYSNLLIQRSIPAKQLKFITHSQYNKLPLPIRISVDVELENLNDSATLWFSSNKARWGDPNCDALTWVLTDSNRGFVFRFDGYRLSKEGLTSNKKVPAMVMNTQTVGLKANISCKITTTKAEYSINGVKYGEASYLQGTVPEVGYFGFDTTWNSGTLHYSNLQISEINPNSPDWES